MLMTRYGEYNKQYDTCQVKNQKILYGAEKLRSAGGGCTSRRSAEEERLARQGTSADQADEVQHADEGAALAIRRPAEARRVGPEERLHGRLRTCLRPWAAA